MRFLGLNVFDAFMFRGTTKTVNVTFFLEQSLQAWRQSINQVVNAINFNKPDFKTSRAMLKAYLVEDNKDHVLIPQSSKFFKFKIGQRVFFDRPKSERRRLNFRYTFDGPGKHRDTTSKINCWYPCKKNSYVQEKLIRPKPRSL